MSADTYHGRPCAHGHTLRYASNRKCVECSRVPARYVVFDDGRMISYHPTIEAAKAEGEDIWLARKL